MKTIRPLMEQAQREWHEVVRHNQRADLVDVLLGIELQIIEALRLESLPEAPQVPLAHLHD